MDDKNWPKWAEAHDKNTDLYSFMKDAFRICSKDEGHPNFRCGVVGTFFVMNRKLFAVTSTQIFKQEWVDLDDGMKEPENVMGKVAWHCSFPKGHVVVTDDASKVNLIRPFGRVVQVDGHTLLLSVEPWVMKDKHFLSGGRWRHAHPLNPVYGLLQKIK